MALLSQFVVVLSLHEDGESVGAAIAAQLRNKIQHQAQQASTVRCCAVLVKFSKPKSSALCRGIWWNLYRVGFASKHIPWQFDCPYGNHNVVQIWKHASQKIMEDTFLSQNKVLRRRKSKQCVPGSQVPPGPLECPLFKRQPIFEELWCTLQWSPAGDLRWWSQPHKVLLQLGPSNPGCGAGLELKKTQKRHHLSRTQF